ncbi:MobC family plasmid mobilization relaxosome protein [Pararhizobium sp. YC-54]|uniref:MobC family plasmid mobilization relaxosome protein n=1 Tax=Pararhizobium sp. YC-54 TaxID=2986920 RepID=UPI0021F7345C|nr:MobC family plasmid mobilization relaxosome protein [Pararhizobium sp. YC-54]MCW0001562.1 MobC family plasmid mobilization relaxosome protein [Pararhizobium sp. YC-54]
MRSEVVRVRLMPEERQALAALCGEKRTASEVIRLLFREQAGLPLPVGPVEADVLRGTNEELRRIGINLNQAVRAMNEGRVGYEPHLDAALRHLVEGVFRLRADVDLMLRISRQARRRGGHGA